jgi:hypothetical protein
MQIFFELNNGKIALAEIKDGFKKVEPEIAKSLHLIDRVGAEEKLSFMIENDLEDLNIYFIVGDVTVGMSFEELHIINQFINDELAIKSLMVAKDV